MSVYYWTTLKFCLNSWKVKLDCIKYLQKLIKS